MLKTNNADLSGDFGLAIAHRDWVWSFPGYSIDPVARDFDLIHLVKA
jgi:hypothetical protein